MHALALTKCDAVARSNFPFRRPRGFTLVELMVTLTVMVILITVAAPSMQVFVNNNRLTSAVNDFVGGLALARSEALKRRTNILVCKSGGGTTCTTSGTWNAGWIVLADADNSATHTTGDVLIRSYEGIGTSTGLTAPVNLVVFDRNGQAGTSQTYAFCNSTINKARLVEIKASGMHTISSGVC